MSMQKRIWGSTKIKSEEFLSAFSELRTMRLALKKVKMSEQTLHKLLRDNFSFKERFDEINTHINSTVKCRKCGFVGPPSEFYLDKKRAHRQRFKPCKACDKARDFEFKSTLHGRFAQIAHAAKTRDANSEINAQNLTDLWEAQGGLCYYTGLPMSLVSGKNGQKNWNIVSVDKKDPSIGYRLSNCVLCSMLVNTSKHNRTEVEFLEFCRLVVNYRLRQPSTS